MNNRTLPANVNLLSPAVFRSSGKMSYPLVVICFLVTSFISFQNRQTLYIIGDSTVKNSSGNGGPGQWGWGTFIAGYFDSARLIVSNQAMAGRSTRTFTSEGRWTRVMSTLKKGDFVMMQFGHNEFIMAELHHNKITLFKGRHHPGPSAF
jgi:lysophospholipase L1-like esterase